MLDEWMRITSNVYKTKGRVTRTEYYVNKFISYMINSKEQAIKA